MRQKIAHYLEIFLLMLCEHGFHAGADEAGCCPSCGERLKYDQTQFDPGHYASKAGAPSIRCPICGLTSYNRHDIEGKYCWYCHVYHGDRYL